MSRWMDNPAGCAIPISMPELPEVETVARQLAPLLEGRCVRSVTVLDPRLDARSISRLVGHRVLAVFRLGKQIGFQLQRGHRPLWMAVHLRMTGRLIWRERSGLARDKHLRVSLQLTGGRLLFSDSRRFGTMQVVDSLDPIRAPGVDPMAPSFTEAALTDLLRGSRQPIKTWLLRQDRITGLGNIYASEILFQAGIDPRRVAGSLGPARVARLHRALVDVLGRAIAACGTTFSDFQDAHGLTGSFQQNLGVYGRENQVCPRCGGVVRRLVQQQRSTYHCGRCQR